MQNSNTYKGYRYQKKCALLYLLDYYWKSDFSYITLEHVDGDDFDLHFMSKKEVYQTKDHQRVPSMKQFLIKMLQRYFENIKGSTEKTLSLLFVFSNDSINKVFTALKTNNKADPALNRIYNSIVSDGKQPFTVTQEEWQEFIRILSLDVIEETKLETELDDRISLICEPYDFDQDQKDFIYGKLLERLNSAMASGSEVNKKVIKEEMTVWHSICFPHHKAYFNYMKKITDKPKTHSPSKVSADETGDIS